LFLSLSRRGKRRRRKVGAAQASFEAFSPQREEGEEEIDPFIFNVLSPRTVRRGGKRGGGVLSTLSRGGKRKTHSTISTPLLAGIRERKGGEKERAQFTIYHGEEGNLHSLDSGRQQKTERKEKGRNHRRRKGENDKGSPHSGSVMRPIRWKKGGKREKEETGPALSLFLISSREGEKKKASAACNPPSIYSIGLSMSKGKREERKKGGSTVRYGFLPLRRLPFGLKGRGGGRGVSKGPHRGLRLYY